MSKGETEDQSLTAKHVRRRRGQEVKDESVKEKETV